jgi:hypothetical protein
MVISDRKFLLQILLLRRNNGSSTERHAGSVPLYQGNPVRPLLLSGMLAILQAEQCAKQTWAKQTWGEADLGRSRLGRTQRPEALLRTEEHAPMAENESANRFAHAMGVAALDLWSDLPQEIQQQLFERAVLAGHKTERDESLREQLAQFLHDHHERTAGR